MSSYRTAAATAALALFMTLSGPLPQVFAPTPAAAQSAEQVLADQTPLQSMDTKAVRERVKTLRALIDSPDLKGDQKKQVRGALKAARDELKNRRDNTEQAGDEENTQQKKQADKQKKENQQADTKNQQKQQNQQSQTQVQQGQDMPPDAAAALKDRRPPNQLSDAELRARIAAGAQASQSSNLTRDQRNRLNDMVAAANRELKGRKGSAQNNQQQQTDTGKKKGNEGTMASGEVESGARKVLTDKRSASSLSDRELRDRVRDTRALLGNKNMQPATMKALRAQLTEDRKELRDRVAQNRNQNNQNTNSNNQNANTSTTTSNQTSVDNQTTLNNSNNNTIDNSTTIINNNTTVNQIVQRRTPSEKLNERDLNRRIRKLEEARRQNRLHGHDLEIASQIIISDRMALRVHLENDRHRRREYIRNHRNEFNLGINVVVAPDYDIAAAEADQEMIQNQLVAAPRWQPRRAYSLQEIVQDDQVRRAMPGIEIDTVTFDFGSAELAPEMVDELENVALVIEKVVAVRPDEVFLIEGHTDAVGSDQANLALSQARAETVKATLADYFAIDPQNLRTVGLGERYLKIPTEEPEQENRRVTVRRITPMLTGQIN